MVELGTRYKCYKCETKFYDLGRPKPICPSCGEDQNNREVRQVLKRRKRRSLLKVEHDALIEHEGVHEDHDAEHEEAHDADHEVEHDVDHDEEHDEEEVHEEEA
ncbi:MAG TPA: FYDLN acid domain-containing protein [Deltaproteobacteria bacterium]|nr:FYDLN acid domain-containing protein [Deltaproteobacteria bacterium]HOI05966.1 FYDLN acid domain-containing protein [Deltaproteobacteria bacterium]